MIKNILVFPCGSEIALEIHKSLKFSSHFNLVGASSIEDHGSFVFENYIGGLPFIYEDNFISELSKVVSSYSIDAIYPAMDAVFSVLKANELALGCKVVGSELETVNLCLSKRETYRHLSDIIKVPHIFSPSEVDLFPVFSKPEVGYGSRGVKLIVDNDMLVQNQIEFPANLLCEYLPGEEYTVDCFTDRHRKLLFYGPRKRQRIMNGISVNTIPVNDEKYEFGNLINQINNSVRFRGAWFAQFKRNDKGELVLLEIAARMGGSSSLYRNQGINFAMLTLFDAFGINVNVIKNNYPIVLDRALDNKYRIECIYNEVFVDFDDCLIIKNKVNTDLIKFLFQSINLGINISLISRHKKDLKASLREFKLENLFTRIIHIVDNSPKSKYIDNRNSIFIDDSFAEREEVAKNKKIPVFSPDMINSLIK